MGSVLRYEYQKFKHNESKSHLFQLLFNTDCQVKVPVTHDRQVEGSMERFLSEIFLAFPDHNKLLLSAQIWKRSNDKSWSMKRKSKLVALNSGVIRSFL